MMLTAGWIYLDGWLLERKWKTFLRFSGFFVLAAWSFLDAVAIDSSALSRLVSIVGLLGSGLVFFSLLIDPVPVKPGEKPIKFFSRFWERALISIPLGLGSFQDYAQNTWGWLQSLPQNLLDWLKAFPEKIGGGAGDASQTLLKQILSFFALFSANLFLFIFEPRLLIFIFFALTTFLLWIHYSRGIQREWKYFYQGFLVLSVSSAFAIAYFWRDSQNVFLSKILSPYQAVWIIENAALFVGAALLAIWAWGFIRFRIFPQIFSGFVAISFLIFVSMTIIYTGFLLNRTQEGAIGDLETNVRTFDFALQKVKDSAILAARIAAANSQVKEAVRLNNKEALFKNLNALMFENETDFMLAVNEGGEVLMRAEDQERFGDSLAQDPVIWRALDGKAVVTIAVEEGVTLSKVTIRASSPVVDAEESGEPRVIGAVVTGFLLDNAFVDGIKRITGLDVAVFAQNIRSASTFTIPESEFRLIGSREANREILDTVFKKKQSYTGIVSLLNQPYLAAYIPIEDVEGTTVGMFFTGRSQSALLALASDTIKRTFAISVVLMIVSVIPLRLLAGFITRNQQV